MFSRWKFQILEFSVIKNRMKLRENNADNPETFWELQVSVTNFDIVFRFLVFLSFEQKYQRNPMKSIQYLMIFMDFPEIPLTPRSSFSMTRHRVQLSPSVL